eukprot:TRINITY_DN3202_c1_g5_i1.p1 TRINITY_DN3202_c1_g5~~TRINITY_DN3202_c1_g5_i1.p1  ORF type:complete len:450 (-),score=115.55 TRINITY_DN3202_c1_g5_i1:193-1494(-)
MDECEKCINGLIDLPKDLTEEEKIDKILNFSHHSERIRKDIHYVSQELSQIEKDVYEMNNELFEKQIKFNYKKQLLTRKEKSLPNDIEMNDVYRILPLALKPKYDCEKTDINIYFDKLQELLMEEHEERQRLSEELKIHQEKRKEMDFKFVDLQRKIENFSQTFPHIRLQLDELLKKISPDATIKLNDKEEEEEEEELAWNSMFHTFQHECIQSIDENEVQLMISSVLVRITFDSENNVLLIHSDEELLEFDQLFTKTDIKTSMEPVFSSIQLLLNSSEPYQIFLKLVETLTTRISLIYYLKELDLNKFDQIFVLHQDTWVLNNGEFEMSCKFNCLDMVFDGKFAVEYDGTITGLFEFGRDLHFEKTGYDFNTLFDSLIIDINELFQLYFCYLLFYVENKEKKRVVYMVIVFYHQLLQNFWPFISEPQETLYI